MISGNGFDGVLNNADTLVLQGNLIGVQADGITPLGNHRHGVRCTSLGRFTMVGGTELGAGNTIALTTVLALQ